MLDLHYRDESVETTRRIFRSNPVQVGGARFCRCLRFLFGGFFVLSEGRSGARGRGYEWPEYDCFFACAPRGEHRARLQSLPYGCHIRGEGVLACEGGLHCRSTWCSTTEYTRPQACSARIVTVRPALLFRQMRVADLRKIIRWPTCTAATISRCSRALLATGARPQVQRISNGRPRTAPRATGSLWIGASS